MDEPLRILVAADVPPDPNAGASGTVYQMNLALRRLGHTVSEIWQHDLGRRIQHGNLHYLVELPRAYRRELKAQLARQSFDVVQFDQPHAFLAADYYRRLPKRGVFVNRSHGHEVRSEETLDPWALQLNGPPKRGLSSIASRLIRTMLNRHWNMVARFSDGFHVSCSEDAEFLQRRYLVPADRIGLITQGTPQSFLDEPALPMNDARRHKLLYVGQYAFFKAPMILAAVVNKALHLRPNLSMTWVCSAKHHSQVRSMITAEIQSRITLIDWRSQEELMRIYDEHGIFLFPSFFEGFGKAPLEALSRGLCVVSSRAGGMRDFIEDHVTGRLVPVGDPDAMLNAALSIVDQPEVCNSMSRAARLKGMQHSWDRCARDAVQFYRQLIKSV